MLLCYDIMKTIYIYIYGRIVNIFIKNTVFFSSNDMIRELFSHFQVKKKSDIYLMFKKKRVSHLYKRNVSICYNSLLKIICTN